MELAAGFDLKRIQILLNIIKQGFERGMRKTPSIGHTLEVLSFSWNRAGTLSAPAPEQLLWAQAGYLPALEKVQ